MLTRRTVVPITPSTKKKVAYFQRKVKGNTAQLGERFFVKSRFEKRGNTVCTRKGYAASVSQLALATAALYFPFSEPKAGSK